MKKEKESPRRQQKPGVAKLAYCCLRYFGDRG
jgi:hypothetical protein